MNATMKLNGKFWNLAVGFKEGLSLGDGTSSQSTWGVNSVLSNLSNWCEDAGCRKNEGNYFLICFVLKWWNLTDEMLRK